MGNAKQAAAYYIARFGFQACAYKGLETGHRDVVSHVIRQRNIFLHFQSPLNPNAKHFSEHMSLHGDAVRDVAFTVDDCRGIYRKAVERGAKPIREPWVEEDGHGRVIMATVATYGDVEHTFVERKAYTGTFLPGFLDVPADPLEALLPPTGLDVVDHIVGNQPDNEMVTACDL